MLDVRSWHKCECRLVRKCLLFGVDRTYRGHREPDAFDPKRIFRKHRATIQAASTALRVYGISQHMIKSSLLRRGIDRQCLVSYSFFPSGGLQMGRLAGRVALVTGSGRGIGRSIALACAREGARVGLTSRTRQQLDDVAAKSRRPAAKRSC